MKINRRCFLVRTGLAGAGMIQLRSIPMLAATGVSPEAPELRFDNADQETLLGAAFRHALRNLLVTNTVLDTKREYNRTGLFTDPPGRFIRAGGDYHTPWTRDASINSWNAASLLCPAVARNTLWAVCEPQANGKLIIQRDNQWWDKVIWVQAAWHHFLVTGDRNFLNRAYEAAVESLAEMRRTRFNERYELFEGPSVLCDGIAGYPEPPFDPKVSSSFILEHPGGDKVMCLSTNCVYYQAFRCASWMGRQLGRPLTETQPYDDDARRLRDAVQRHLWMSPKSTCGYFIHGAGPLSGQLDPSQEAMGLAYAILFDVVDAARVRDILRTVHVQPKGIVCVWPHFPRFNDARPGRHNVLVWPMASGMWAHAAAKAGAIGSFASEMANVAAMANGSGENFFEIYHSVTGVPEGGWQVGRHWDSCRHQTWSATGYLRMVFYGLFGLKFELEGLRLAPTLPPGWGTVRLHGLRYRQARFNLRLEGEGQRIARATLDGRPWDSATIPATLTGQHDVVVRLEPDNARAPERQANSTWTRS